MSGRAKASPQGGTDPSAFDPKAPLDRAHALVPSVMRVNEQRVARGFWPKVRRVAAHVPFAGDALAVWFSARDDETPIAAKGLMLAALAYFVLPTDAVPDIIAGLGYTDDAAVFAAMLALVGRHVKPRHREAGRAAIDAIRGGD